MSEDDINSIITLLLRGNLPFENLHNMLGDVIVAVGNYFLEQQENMDLAEQIYLIASQKGEKDADFNLGLIYEEKEQYDKMVEYYSKCDNDLSNFYLGNYYRKIGNEEKMLYHWNKSNYENTFVNLGIYYYQINDEEKMIEYWLKANNYDSLMRLSKYYYEKGDYNNVDKYYDMAIELQ